MDGELYEKARDAYIKYAQIECGFAKKVQEEMEDLREQAHLVRREGKKGKLWNGSGRGRMEGREKGKAS